MKPLFIYSVNDDIIERLKTALSESDYSIDSFSSLIDLQSALEQCSIVTLVFYLENNNSSESELATIQRDYKQKINTLVLNNTPTPEQGVRLLNLNIRGYTNSFIEPSKLITALSVIEQGEIWAGASLIQYMLNKAGHLSENNEHDNKKEQKVFQLLTSREQQIAQKILSGLQNKLIADQLSITERTVKAHLSTIFKKLGVRNRLELTLKLQKADRRLLQ